MYAAVVPTAPARPHGGSSGRQVRPPSRVTTASGPMSPVSHSSSASPIATGAASGSSAAGSGTSRQPAPSSDARQSTGDASARRTRAQRVRAGDLGLHLGTRHDRDARLGVPAVAAVVRDPQTGAADESVAAAVGHPDLTRAVVAAHLAQRDPRIIVRRPAPHDHAAAAVGTRRRQPHRAGPGQVDREREDLAGLAGGRRGERRPGGGGAGSAPSAAGRPSRRRCPPPHRRAAPRASPSRVVPRNPSWPPGICSSA